MVIHLRSVHVEVVARVNAKRTWDVPSYFVSPRQSHVILSFSYLLPHIATICSYLFWYTTLRDEVAMLTPPWQRSCSGNWAIVWIFQGCEDCWSSDPGNELHHSREDQMEMFTWQGARKFPFKLRPWCGKYGYLGGPRIWVPPNYLELNHFRYVSIEILGFRVPPFWKTSISSWSTHPRSMAIVPGT